MQAATRGVSVSMPLFSFHGVNSDTREERQEMEDNAIYTPVPQGTFQARLVWDNESETDGIEISLLRDNGDVDVLFEIVSGEKGLDYNVMLPLDDMNKESSMCVERDDDKNVLYLKSREENGNHNRRDEPGRPNER